MQRLKDLQGSFNRLSLREKGLIIGMVASLFGVVLFFVVLGVNSSLSSLEESVREGRRALRDIYARGAIYQRDMVRRRESQRLIDENPITSLRIPVNAMARNITVESDEQGYAGHGRRLSDLISYGGKTTETRIESSRQNRRGRRGDQEEGGNYEIEQNLEFDDIPLATLYEFLEELKSTDDLIFIRRLEINRRFNNLEHARATVTVSTIKYLEAEDR